MNKIQEFLAQFTLECLETISIVSYDILLIGGLIGLILYVFGWKRGKNVCFLFPAVYMILQIIVKVMCHA